MKRTLNGIQSDIRQIIKGLFTFTCTMHTHTHTHTIYYQLFKQIVRRNVTWKRESRGTFPF